MITQHEETDGRLRSLFDTGAATVDGDELTLNTADLGIEKSV